MRLLPAGSAALLADFCGPEEVIAFHEELLRRKPRGAEEFIPASQTILITFDPARTSHRQLADALTRTAADLARAASSSPAPSRPAPDRVPAVIPVTYDGPDLDEVARDTGLTLPEIIRRHTVPVYTVAFCGFAPGFAYLTGLDPALMLPRQPVPRTRVPAGSVAVSGQYTAVYPRTSPGGWRLLGRTTAVMWDLTREQPALLTPGSRIRFTEADRLSRSCASARSPQSRIWDVLAWPPSASAPPAPPTEAA
jgi:5-oxoprolinase (ATP-hydrolysing) subunit B